MVPKTRLGEDAFRDLRAYLRVQKCLIQRRNQLAASDGVQVLLETRKARLIVVGDDQLEPAMRDLRIRALAERKGFIKVGELRRQQRRGHVVQEVQPLLGDPVHAEILRRKFSREPSRTRL